MMIKAIQKHHKDNRVTLIKEVDESTSGPESITMTNPDCNMIIIDPHVYITYQNIIKK